MVSDPVLSHVTNPLFNYHVAIVTVATSKEDSWVSSTAKLTFIVVGT